MTRLRRLDLALRLLDRQIIDRHGRPTGKVDDLEFDLAPDGTALVSGLLVGPMALGPRLGGRLGATAVGFGRRMRAQAVADPPAIPIDAVARIDSAVELSVSADLLDVERSEDWVRDHVVTRIPGSRHDPE